MRISVLLTTATLLLGIVSAATAQEPSDPPPELEGPPTVRLEGENRFETTIAISRDRWDDGEAEVVVLARADDFADALAGTPLAVALGGPLLITDRDRLTADIADEAARVLGNDGDKTIYLLGGPVALDERVASDARDLDHDVERLQGQDRYETAVVIARALPRVDTFLITTGTNFPDALAAGPAAAGIRGAIVLSQGDQPNRTTTAYLNRFPGTPQFAIGGPAATAYPFATPIVGDTRADTAVRVATRFFDDPRIVGIARQDNFPDSLAGGTHIAGGLPDEDVAGGPVLLTDRDRLSDEVRDYLCDHEASLERAYLYGGPAALSENVEASAGPRVEGRLCD